MTVDCWLLTLFHINFFYVLFVVTCDPHRWYVLHCNWGTARRQTVYAIDQMKHSRRGVRYVHVKSYRNVKTCFVRYTKLFWNIFSFHCTILLHPIVLEILSHSNDDRDNYSVCWFQFALFSLSPKIIIIIESGVKLCEICWKIIYTFHSCSPFTLRGFFLLVYSSN